jgi:hypothetical protein
MRCFLRLERRKTAWPHGGMDAVGNSSKLFDTSGLRQNSARLPANAGAEKHSLWLRCSEDLQGCQVEQVLDRFCGG